MKAPISLLILFLFCCTANAQRRTNMAGTVVDVLSGDVIIVKGIGDARFTIKLRYVDAPEPSQELYQTAKDHLSALVLNKDVLFDIKAMSGNVVFSKVTVNGVDIGMQMLRDGAAFYDATGGAYQETADRSGYTSNETLAKNEKRGVWALNNVVPVYQLRAEREKRERERMQKEFDEWLKSAAAMAKFRSPTIGMHYFAFKSLCDPGSTGGDYVNTTEYDDLSIRISVTLAYTKSRDANQCYGDYTFDNFRLTRMSHGVRTEKP